ncbi:putative LRR receptor-like serine/threonine-protein kinase [Prunus yedoensis var. nudiflora]|uniref:Putative LRR receptor-like serine/threonine-protein kinase n=1 Tax=Prunus yedoensis var. nudiflora TaxID=2094558 RepID=A0A314XR38_PRUYE|nr:putative LRR receptor-like serine/threonine-protein kinase [Prunus yedoensis var. nudiflora]
MGQNQLHGKVPSLKSLISLEELVLAINHLGSGGIGDLTFLCVLTNATRLGTLQIQMNTFGGMLPQCIANLSSLRYFHVNEIKIFGSIPNGFGNLVNLESVSLYGNRFSGNKLQGNVLSTLAQCHNLIILALEDNDFNGIVSQEIRGSLPQDIGKLINLEFLDISGNKLFGEIPPSLGSCIKLEYLDMHGNFFQGKIPSSLESLRGHGTNQRSFQECNCHISGGGNSKLCGGIPEFHLPKCRFQHKRELSPTLKLIISLVFGILGVILVLTFLYLQFLRRGKKESASSDSDKFLKVSYQSLLKATDAFSSTNLIGMGSFGSVYKGVLEDGGTTIAIKVFNLVRRGAYKSFTAECEALKNIRHRNLVKVLSVCSGSDYRGNDFKALIYEFMVNGSLEEWLHPAGTNGEINDRQSSLTFCQRLNIAIHVAMALEYLHHHCETPIVHCDLKPSNVLLGDDMIGHVGDFGLAKFLPITSQTSSGNQSSSLGIKGTIDYTPPGT